MMTSLEYDRALEEQASALTTCSICTDVFKEPKVLPCNHTFCLLCLQRHHDSTNSLRLIPVSSFSCPTCRKVCYVPRHSLDQLPNDFKVDQILDLVKAMSRSRASSLPLQKNTDVHGQGHGQGHVPLSECVVCRSARAVATPSEVFCVQCARSFCSACADHHSRTPIFHGHTVVPAAGSVSVAWRCPLHELEILYFCDLCDAPACTICVLSIHERHSISDQGTVVARLRSHLTKSFERLKQRRDDFTSQLEEVSLLRLEHVRSLQDTERNVLRASREAYRRIREEEEHALTDVRSCSKEKLERMDSTERELTARLESLAGLCRSHAEVLALTNAKTFFDSYTQLAADLGDGAEVSGAAGPEVEPALRDVSTFVARIQVRLGEVEKRAIDVKTLPRSPKKDLDGTRISAEAESKRTLTVTAGKDAEHQRLPDSSSTSSPASELGQGHDQGQGHGEGQGKGQRRGRREECLNPVERKHFHSSHSSMNTTSSANSTNSRDNNSRANNSVGTGSSCSTSSGNNNATVNSNGTTSKSSNVGINLNCPNSLNGNVEGSTPRNCTTPTKNNYSTTYASNNFNNNNRHTVERSKSSPRSNGHHGTKTTRSTNRTNGTPQLLWVSEDFSRCTDCAFTSNGQLVATDYAVATNRVKIYSSCDGRLVDTIDSCLIVQPWGLCYNESCSSILLSDHGNPSIKTVRLGSSSSPEVRVYPSRSARPSGIAVTRSGDLIVTDTGSRAGFKVGVYSIDQCRMTRTREFGCHGDGEGEILRPNFVTVDHSDRIVLSDCESHTVKVFSLTGQQLLKFNSFSANGSEMCPQGLAIDNVNSILVADQAVRAVVKYTSDGQLLQTVVQTSGLPWGISVSWELNLLAVATSRGLEVYRL